MPWQRLLALAAALVVTGALTAQAVAQRWEGNRADWVLLGERSVSFRVDRDAVTMTQPEAWYHNRAFRRLHLIAERSDIHLISVRLVYMNGSAESFPVNRLIRDGQDQPIDLSGPRKYLQRVEFVYRSRPSYEGRAVMKVYGEPARFAPGPGPLPPIGPGVGPGAPGQAPGADWVEFGCQRVSLFGIDHDSIHVGRHQGRYKAIRLHVRGADIQVLDLTVIYANGAPDRIPVRALIRQGDRTRRLDLKGRERAIRQVEMSYVTIPNFKGLATVCVEGLQ